MKVFLIFTAVIFSSMALADVSLTLKKDIVLKPEVTYFTGFVKDQKSCMISFTHWDDPGKKEVKAGTVFSLDSSLDDGCTWDYAHMEKYCTHELTIKNAELGIGAYVECQEYGRHATGISMDTIGEILGDFMSITSIK